MKQDKYQEGLSKLEELIKDVEVAMLTTEDAAGTLRSRPMQTQIHDFDGRLWFFTSYDSQKVDEIRICKKVNLAYANPNGNTFVSVSGTAKVTHDQEKIDKFWKKSYDAWFPQGKEDPELVLLEVDVEKAEYWDAPSSKMVMLAGMVKAKLTGEEFRPGEHEEILVNQGELAHTR